jgi:DNA-binding response OmpR family regulator
MKILIISDSERVRDFFRLEALGFKIPVDCFEKFERMHKDMSEYDLAIIDVDSVKQVPLNPAKRMITVSQASDSADFRLPMRISELQRIYSELFLPRIKENASTDTKDDFKIVFFKKEKNTVGLLGKKYILSDFEYITLSLLCKSFPNEIKREELDLALGGGKSNIPDVYICKLRKKLEAPNGRKLIETVRNKGYKILADAEWR